MFRLSDSLNPIHHPLLFSLEQNWLSLFVDHAFPNNLSMSLAWADWVAVTGYTMGHLPKIRFKILIWHFWRVTLTFVSFVAISSGNRCQSQCWNRQVIKPSRTKKHQPRFEHRQWASSLRSNSWSCSFKARQNLASLITMAAGAFLTGQMTCRRITLAMVIPLMK